VQLVEDLDAAEQRMRAQAAEFGLRLLPLTLHGHGWEAVWPDGDDPDRFVELAAELGAPALYLVAAGADPALLETSSAVAKHGGEVATLVAAFVAGGVLHRFEVAACWYGEAAQGAEFAADIERHNREQHAEQMARTVVVDPAFQVHSGACDDAKFAAIEVAFPEIDEETAWLVWRAANRIDKTELKPAREAEWARAARELMAGGATQRAAAGELGISVGVLARVLQQNRLNRS
jgi:hypothetical protein